MSKIYIALNEENMPDYWSVAPIPGALEFNESELPENYSVAFGERKWKIVDGKFVAVEQENPVSE